MQRQLAVAAYHVERLRLHELEHHMWKNSHLPSGEKDNDGKEERQEQCCSSFWEGL
jgi:hypothetical protein